jgi:four helix bundle protein
VEGGVIMPESRGCSEDARLSARRNVNRGYRKLRVWLKAVDLYVLACQLVKEIPGRPFPLMNQITEAASSISSNVSEGYCRRTLKEYLQFLNYSLGSCGEVYSRCYGCAAAGQLQEKSFEQFDRLHFEVENLLLALIESLQRKQKCGDWEDNFAEETGPG